MRRSSVTLASLFAASCSLFTDLGELSNDDASADAGAGDGGGVDGTTRADGSMTLEDGALPMEAYIVGAGGAVPGDGGVAATAATLIARILPDGSLGAWANGPALPVARRRHGVIGIGDTLHVIGGYTPTSFGVTDVTSARIGDGGTLGAFTASAPLTDYVTDSCPVIAGNRAYLVLPGASSIERATLAPGGFGGWQVQKDLDGGAGTYYGRAAAIGSQIFWFGEEGKAIALTIDADGKAGPWRALATMPILFTNNSGAVATHERFVYLLGGYRTTGGGFPTADVYVAEVGSDGSLGAWIPTEPYPRQREFYSAVSYGGYLYVLGGSLVGTDIKDVSFAKIRADGKLEPFRSTSALPNVPTGVCGYGAIAR